jgi:hypothetical protein
MRGENPNFNFFAPSELLAALLAEPQTSWTYTDFPSWFMRNDEFPSPEAMLVRACATVPGIGAKGGQEAFAQTAKGPVCRVYPSQGAPIPFDKG